MVTEQILGETALPYRLQEMTWIGTPTTVTDTCLVWHTAKVQSLQDLKQHELVIAGTGNEASQIALLQRLVGGRIRSVIGYPGGPPSNMAMERGEVGGRCSYSWEAITTAIPDWVRDKKMKPIVQFALTRHPDLPDVPLITDFARNDLDRQALRVLLTPQIFGFPVRRAAGAAARRARSPAHRLRPDHAGPAGGGGGQEDQAHAVAGERSRA